MMRQRAQKSRAERTDCACWVQGEIYQPLIGSAGALADVEVFDETRQRGRRRSQCRARSSVRRRRRRRRSRNRALVFWKRLKQIDYEDDDEKEPLTTF
jgi:hypothetical protein